MSNGILLRLYEIRMREMHLDLDKVVFSSLLFALQDSHAPQLSVRVTVALVELFFFSSWRADFARAQTRTGVMLAHREVDNY